MLPQHQSENADRQQTDDSLRIERATADQTRADELAINGLADAVINSARMRVDKALAAARSRADRSQVTSSTGGMPPATIQAERALADQAMRDDRANADESLSDERAEQVAHLLLERTETDRDLSSERSRSDELAATRTEFLSIASHDLRNMLLSVAGFAELIPTAASRQQLLKHVEEIRRASARMERLVGDLVDVASIEAGVLAQTCEILDTDQVVREVVDTFQAQASNIGAQLVTEIVEPSVLAVFDPARILQVLVNLLGNAIKFSLKNGKIVVRSERIGDEMHLSVSDTGMGIPDDKLEVIFDPFVQGLENDRRGQGLGLHICKHIVEAHGGRIWAENNADYGSRICFTLPIYRALSQSRPAP